MSQQKKNPKTGRNSRPPPTDPGSRAHAAPTSSTQRRQAEDPYDNLPPNPHSQRPGPPPPSPYDRTQNRPRPPSPGRRSFLPPPPPPPPSSAPSSGGGRASRRDNPSAHPPGRPSFLPPPPPPPPPAPPRRGGQDQGSLGPAYGVAQQHRVLPSSGGSAFNPSAHGIGAVSKSFGEVSLDAPVEERLSAYDSRARQRSPRMGDTNWVEPLPNYDDPDPSEQSQPEPRRRPRHGPGSSQPSTRPGKAKGTASLAPLSNLLETAGPPQSRRRTAHEQPSPPEKSKEAKRRKGTTKEVVYSVPGQEAPEKTVKYPQAKPKKWEPEEDEALKEAFEECRVEGKSADWNKIWEAMKRKGYGDSRYPSAISQRWTKISPTPLVDWTPREEQLLNELRATGAAWKQISESMWKFGRYDRSQSSCRHHWRVINGLD